MDNITVYGAPWCPDCRRSKRFLSEQQIDYEWVDIEQNQEGQAYVEEINDGKRIIPTIVFDDDSILVEPSNAELAEKLGLSITDPHDFHDVTIIGAGPAGLTAAIYAARDGFSVMVIDEGALGGQAATTESLEKIQRTATQPLQYVHVTSRNTIKNGLADLRPASARDSGMAPDHRQGHP